MSASTNSNGASTLPQGFSVYQPALGAHLQFFPAVGTQQLDDMLNAYIPGPAAVQEKRATVSLDFLEYAQVTGQAFKFYPVYSMGSAAASPATASPLQDSASSFNVSPVTPSWDWSQASSRSGTQPRQARKSVASTSRHQPTDFSHLPGMQIMTKDGRDVTNSASRGSKTKEQRDHAHLMRVIKACEACRRRKTRCDPSHKKRTVVSATQAPAVKAAKKAKTPSQLPPAMAPSLRKDEAPAPATPFDVDSSFSLTGFEDFDFSTIPVEDNWEQFLQFPDPDDNYDFFLDPNGLLSPDGSSFTSSSSSSASPHKSSSPQSDLEALGISPTTLLNTELQAMSSRSFLDQDSGTTDYVDFNLFSPQSSFSEDDLMIDIQSSSGRLATPDPQSDPGRQPPTRPPYDALSGPSGVDTYAGPFDSPGDELSSSNYDDRSPWFDPGRLSIGESSGGSLSLSATSGVSSRGGAIDLSMRVLGERTYHEEQACGIDNLSPSSSSGPVLGQSGTDNLSPSSSSGLVRGQSGPDNLSPSSSSGLVRGLVGTDPTVATAAPGVDDERNWPSVARAPATVHTSPEGRSAARTGPDGFDAQLAASSAGELRVNIPTQPRADSPLSTVGAMSTTETTVAADHNGLAEVPATTSAAHTTLASGVGAMVPSSWFMDSSSTSIADVSSTSSRGGVVSGCKSFVSTMSPLSAVTLALGLLTLTISAMIVHGLHPSVVVWAALTLGMTSPTASRSNTRHASNTSVLDARTKALAGTHTLAEHDSKTQGDCSLSPTARGPVASLRLRASLFLSSAAPLRDSLRAF